MAIKDACFHWQLSDITGCVTFPSAGSYPYVLDYRSGTGGALGFSIGRVRPAVSLVLTSTLGSAITGQTATITEQATDETGAPLAQLPLNVVVTGVNSQTLTGTTDSTGKATVSYSGWPRAETWSRQRPHSMGCR